jgi:endonuclease/exonuclease/phosphatase (EEP) superfamily protein YafD
MFCMAGLTFGLTGLALALLGDSWVALDVFSQFAMQFMFIIAASVAGLLMPKFKAVIACVALALLVVGYGLQPIIVAPPESPRAGETVLRVASFNTWMENSPADAVKGELLRIAADVVVLVEVDVNKQAMFDQLRAAYPYQYVCTFDVYCNLAILSKYPLRDTSYQQAWDGPPMIRATLGGPVDGLTVFGIHTTRFPYSRAHLNQIRALAAEVDKVKGPVIVMGDMNATPFSRVTQTLAADAGLTRLTNLPSWPSFVGLPQVAIDHIFVSPGIRPLQRQLRGNAAGSDHYPISMVLAVP